MEIHTQLRAAESWEFLVNLTLNIKANKLSFNDYSLDILNYL